ncbi:MAG: hypothetical protein ACR2NM_17750, partial [Bythopirellula sp.]
IDDRRISRGLQPYHPTRLASLQGILRCRLASRRGTVSKVLTKIPSIDSGQALQLRRALTEEYSKRDIRHA